MGLSIGTLFRPINPETLAFTCPAELNVCVGQIMGFTHAASEEDVLIKTRWLSICSFHYWAANERQAKDRTVSWADIQPRRVPLAVAWEIGQL